MTKGVLLFAYNNNYVDYVKQAIYCAKRIKEYLSLPVTLVTSDENYLSTQFPFYKNFIDDVITQEASNTKQMRKFFDGGQNYKTLPWNNFTRADCYDLSPYDETIVMDTDFLVGNSKLLHCFENDIIKISKKVVDIKSDRNDNTLLKVSDTSIDMYWATVFYFKKNKESEIFFNLVRHIRDNWNFYRLQYQIFPKNFRNDFAFSIAIHIMSGFENSTFVQDVPGTIWFSSDKDKLMSIKNNNKFTFLLDDPLLISVTDCNIHVMNKFTLDNIINEELDLG